MRVESYGIKKAEFFILEKDKPSFEYIEFIDNLFDELVVYINTDSDNLIESTCEKILGIYNLYKIIRISTPNINLIKNDIILKYSENVAIKSGFEETSRSHFFTIVIRRIPEPCLL